MFEFIDCWLGNHKWGMVRRNSYNYVPPKYFRKCLYCDAEQMTDYTPPRNNELVPWREVKR